MILMEDVKKILKCFNVDDTVVNVCDIQETKENGKLRCVYRFDMCDDKKWICRISCEPHFPKSLIEQQSCFAMMLYKNGISTPRKLSINGKYCFEFLKNKNKFCVTLEEYAGHDLENVTLDLFVFLGKILGETHRLSEKNRMFINYSTISEALKSGRTSFKNILSVAEPSMPCRSLNDHLVFLHDSLVKEMAEVWEILPHGAVHGDLGVYNNMVCCNGKISIIDFNLSGDEVYMADMLIAFYASLYKCMYMKGAEHIDCNEALKLFISAYEGKRHFTAIERIWYSKVAALFDGLFYSKAIIGLWNESQHKDYIVALQKAIECFDPTRHPLICN